MNFYDFINSRDIREYLERQNYELDPLQKAFLVWQSENHTFTQKHKAWQEIIDTLPDMEVPERINCAGWKSLHEMLEGYIAMENKYLELFKKYEPDAAYYIAEEFEEDRYQEKSWKGNWFDLPMRALKFEDIWNATLKEIAEDEEGYMKKFRITKYYFNCPDYERRITLEYDRSGELISMLHTLPREDNKEAAANVPRYTESEVDLDCQSFLGLWFDIPIPFEKGDIVCDCTKEEPFVLLGTVPWTRRENPKKYKNKS